MRESLYQSESSLMPRVFRKSNLNSNILSFILIFTVVGMVSLMLSGFIPGLSNAFAQDEATKNQGELDKSSDEGMTIATAEALHKFENQNQSPTSVPEDCDHRGGQPISPALGVSAVGCQQAADSPKPTTFCPRDLSDDGSSQVQKAFLSERIKSVVDRLKDKKSGASTLTCSLSGTQILRKLTAVRFI